MTGSKRARITVAVGGTLVAGLAGPNGPLGGFWGVEPTPGLEGGVLGALMLYSVIEAVVFGIGLTWLIFGRDVLRGPGSTAAHLAVGWALVSWFPHGAFHQSTAHDNWAALAAIEYGFHFTMLIAGLLVARHLILVGRPQAVAA